MILLLDNYDSFVQNVARALREMGAEVEVVRSDALTVGDALAASPSHLVLSPGPCTPTEAGISVELVRALDGAIPVLGICLGHQAVAVAYGGTIVPAAAPTHGRAVEIFHEGEGILSGLPSPFSAGLYHSLAVSAETLPPVLRPMGWNRSGELMAFRHRSDPVWGVQFHPESILTPLGDRIFGNFLSLSGTGRFPSAALPAGAFEGGGLG